MQNANDFHMNIFINLFFQFLHFLSQTGTKSVNFKGVEQFEKTVESLNFKDKI